MPTHNAMEGMIRCMTAATRRGGAPHREQIYEGRVDKRLENRLTSVWLLPKNEYINARRLAVRMCVCVCLHKIRIYANYSRGILPQSEDSCRNRDRCYMSVNNSSFFHTLSCPSNDTKIRRISHNPTFRNIF